VAKRATLDALAKKLLEHEVVERTALVALLAAQDEAGAALKRAAASNDAQARTGARHA